MSEAILELKKMPKCCEECKFCDAIGSCKFLDNVDESIKNGTRDLRCPLKPKKLINRSEAYKIVFDDLTKCNMFKGIYDAINGKPSFMHGIWTVMERIASEVSKDCYEQFTQEFERNMVDSKANANQNESR